MIKRSFEEYMLQMLVVVKVISCCKGDNKSRLSLRRVACSDFFLSCKESDMQVLEYS